MKKVWIFIIVIMMLTGYTYNGYAYQDIAADSVKEVSIGYSTPDINERDLYGGYKTTNINEIQMISHYLAALKKTEGGGGPSDSRTIFITFNYDSGNSARYDIYPTVLNIFDFDRDMVQRQTYKFPFVDYYRLCDFLNCLILNKFDKDTAISGEPSKWAEIYVDNAVQKGIVPEWNQIGYANYISRVEVCQLVDNFFEIKGINREVPNDYTYLKDYPFNDTKDISVKELYVKNIISGKSETEFCPYDNITREEFAQVLLGACKLVANIELTDSAVLQYKDMEQVSDWAVDSVRTITSLGLMQGDETGHFKPQENITKEEVIVTLLRLLDLSK